jgi:hypothetical protein
MHRIFRLFIGGGDAGEAAKLTSTDQVIWSFYYSYRNASTGLSIAARRAG